MSKKSISFDDKKINKSNFYKNKKLFKIDDIELNKILVSKEVSNMVIWQKKVNQILYWV